ncbi:hypothetical protein L210DRAFT_988785 [Boletus edulis BED1]|uniref:Uncharacterized protein n=1 Tax=Boletus edulis BED1 TaxID=1328754 RepID=A0AAD4G6Y7_BOLED|nr:hypothetical protein L210DRAFT_988785 [Boletus edulis BED1]
MSPIRSLVPVARLIHVRTQVLLLLSTFAFKSLDLYAFFFALYTSLSQSNTQLLTYLAKSRKVISDYLFSTPFTKPADSPVAPCETENSLHGVPWSEAPAKPVVQPQAGHDCVPYSPGYMKPIVQPQGFENPTIPPQLGHDHVPYPPGWFGPPGTGPCFRGYPGPFFGPYGGWGMFPDMNPSDAGPSVLPAGSEGQLENVASFDPTAFFKLYGQHFMYPNASANP